MEVGTFLFACRNAKELFALFRRCQPVQVLWNSVGVILYLKMGIRINQRFTNTGARVIKSHVADVNVKNDRVSRFGHNLCYRRRCSGVVDLDLWVTKGVSMTTRNKCKAALIWRQVFRIVMHFEHEIPRVSQFNAVHAFEVCMPLARKRLYWRENSGHCLVELYIAPQKPQKDRKHSRRVQQIGKNVVFIEDVRDIEKLRRNTALPTV